MPAENKKLINRMILNIKSSSPEPQAGIGMMNTGQMKSYELINAKLEPASVTLVARVAEKLLSMGFVIITARFGDSPSITVKPTMATRQLDSVCTGQCGIGGQMYKTYAAGFDGVKVVWYKAIRPWAVH